MHRGNSGGCDAWPPCVDRAARGGSAPERPYSNEATGPRGMAGISLHSCPSRVRPPREVRAQLGESPCALRQDLKRVPVCLHHDVERAPNVGGWNRLMKQIAHRVDEDHLRLLPSKRKLKLVWM